MNKYKKIRKKVKNYINLLNKLIPNDDLYSFVSNNINNLLLEKYVYINIDKGRLIINNEKKFISFYVDIYKNGGNIDSIKTELIDFKNYRREVKEINYINEYTVLKEFEHKEVLDDIDRTVNSMTDLERKRIYENGTLFYENMKKACINDKYINEIVNEETYIYGTKAATKRCIDNCNGNLVYYYFSSDFMKKLKINDKNLNICYRTNTYADYFNEFINEKSLKEKVLSIHF